MNHIRSQHRVHPCGYCRRSFPTAPQLERHRQLARDTNMPCTQLPDQIDTV